MARNLPSELNRSDLTAPIRPLSTARLLPGCLMSHIRVVVSCIHIYVVVSCILIGVVVSCIHTLLSSAHEQYGISPGLSHN